MPLLTIFAVYAALVGLVIGSYLNVVIYRLPRDLSTVRPRSRCPGCGSLIRPLDNIPVFSWLLLRGRCRTCKTPISARYPLIEALTAALFVLCFLAFGFSWETPVAALFCSLMIALAGIDIEHYILPDRLTLPGIVVGIALQPWLRWARIGDGPLWALAGGLLGAVLGAAILLAVWGAWYLVRKEEGMGLGDVKMLAMIGAFLGWRGVLVALFFSALTGALLGLALIGLRRLSLRSALPYGVFLSFGGLIALFAGERIVAAYASLL